MARTLRHQTVDTGDRVLDVAVAAVALVAWGVQIAWTAPVRVTDLARGVGGSVPAVRSRVLTALAKEETGMDQVETFGNVVARTARAEEIAGAFANVTAGRGAVGEVVKAGDRSMVPLIETIFSGGYGGGGGLESASANAGLGGGGGGFARSRAIAVVEVAPEAVTVRPVVDKTAVTLAGIAAAIGILNTLMRARRRR